MSPFHMGEGNKARNIGKAPQDPPSPPNCCPHPHHPLPAPPHALNTLLCCSSCFPPHTRGDFSSMGTAHVFQKCTWRGSKGRKSLECPRGVARAWCPQLCPSPRGTHRTKDHSHSSSATGISACRLCPAGWQPFAAKCYWVSTKNEFWEVAEANCSYQRSQLVMLESVEEKVNNCGGKARVLPLHLAF